MAEEPRARKRLTLEESEALVRRLREKAWRNPGVTKELRISALRYARILDKINRSRAQKGKK